MRSVPGQRLTVEARLLADPCLWCWEVRDAARGDLLESSWANHWAAYASREEARTAGYLRLAPPADQGRREEPSVRAGAVTRAAGEASSVGSMIGTTRDTNAERRCGGRPCGKTGWAWGS